MVFNCVERLHAAHLSAYLQKGSNDIHVSFLFYSICGEGGLNKLDFADWTWTFLLFIIRLIACHGYIISKNISTHANGVWRRIIFSLHLTVSYEQKKIL